MSSAIPSATANSCAESNRRGDRSAGTTRAPNSTTPSGRNPRVRPIVRAVWRRAEKESMVLGMGRCHDVPARMVSVLKPRHGIPRVS